MLETRAFLDVTMATTDKSRVKLDALDLVIDYSAPHLRPMLAVRLATPCVGHRPWFDLVNHGLGPVEEPSLRVSFGRYADEGDLMEVVPVTDWVEVPISGFQTGTTVQLGETLRQLGVDVDTLAGNRFTCPRQEMVTTCAENLLASVQLGALEGLAEADLRISVPFHAELSYSWTDAWGQRTPITETINSQLTLAQLELSQFLAEMGDGGAFAAPAPDFQDISLPVPAEGTRINLPLRGNPNVASATAYVQLHSDRNSIHAMHFEARLADGSVQSSMPVVLYFLAPEDGTFVTEARPGACFLKPDF